MKRTYRFAPTCDLVRRFPALSLEMPTCAENQRSGDLQNSSPQIAYSKHRCFTGPETSTLPGGSPEARRIYRHSLGFFVLQVSIAESAILFEAQLFGGGSLVLCGRVVASLTLRTSQSHNDTHLNSPLCGYQSTIPVSTPAPTVRPPSRMAKRRPSSMATGVMRATSQLMLSPGMTISTPSGRVRIPVTSVVRK